MKKIQTVATSLIALGALSSALSADDLHTSLTDGKFDANLKSFYFHGDRDNRTDREALAVGGILKYESACYYGFKVGTAFYVSHDLLRFGDQTAQKGSIENGGSVNIVTKDLAGNTEMVNSDGSDIEVLGEAYLQYTIGGTRLKVGRQRINTPLMNDYYNRFLPNSFEAAVLTNKDIPGTELIGIYAYGWKYKASDTFIKMTEALGDPNIDENMAVVGFKNKSIPKLQIQAYDYFMNNVMNTVYLQVDGKKVIDTGFFNTSFALQYLQQTDKFMEQIDMGDSLLGEFDTYLAGGKLAFGIGNASLKFMYDKVGDYTIKGSGTSYSKMGYSKFVNFTDIQIDGEALNAGAESYGVVFGYKFGNLKPAVKYVHIEQDLEKQAAGDTPNTRPSSDEYNLDIKYKINSFSKLRVRFAYIDYESTHKNEFDEINTRVIYDYKFSLSGK